MDVAGARLLEQPIQPARRDHTANAKNLHVSWTFSTGVLRGHEGQPLVVDNTMYLITPYPNVAYALDLDAAGFR
jgi:glucose dehydrogenase